MKEIKSSMQICIRRYMKEADMALEEMLYDLCKYNDVIKLKSGIFYIRPK